MSEFPPVIYVDLEHTPRSKRNPLSKSRPQRWRWTAKNARNNEALAVSSEAYTNRGDCLYAIAQLFGPATNVYLREAERGNQTLRMAVEPE